MKNINQMREILCEEIDNLRAKKTTAANVNAIVNATGKILTTIKMELEYSKLMGRQPNLAFIPLGPTSKAQRSDKTEKTATPPKVVRAA